VRNLLTIMAFCALLPLLACESSGPLDKLALPGPGPTGLDEQQFDDVPTAGGFRLVTERSFSHQTGDLRLGRFVYEGRRLSPGDALAFYRTEMVRALYGWTIDQVDPEAGFATFRKGRDEARVQSGKRGEVTRVTVDVNYREETTRTQP